MGPSKNIKKFTCEICSKQFSSHDYKKKHITIVHEEVKKYLCNVCNKKFGWKIELSKHVENNDQGSLSLHLKNVHKLQKNSNVILVENPSRDQDI